jgi:hypothetical protein
VRTSHDDIAAQLARLEHLPSSHPGVVSVYLNTRWSDEHQRDRTRVFVTGELHRARQAAAAEGEDLDWVEREGEMLVSQVERPDAKGVALFACRALGLREVILVRLPFRERFVVADRPDLGALVELLDEHASAIVAFVDGESARLVAVHPGGAGDEVTLQSDVAGRHDRGGWAQLAQSRYARHIEARRGRAVAGPGTLEAARRGAIHRLYILAGIRRPGQECERCGALQETGPTCWLCEGAAREVELAAALVERVQRRGDG